MGSSEPQRRVGCATRSNAQQLFAPFVRPPGFYEEWLRAVKFVQNLDWTSLAVPGSCLVDSFRGTLMLRWWVRDRR